MKLILMTWIIINTVLRKIMRGIFFVQYSFAGKVRNMMLRNIRIICSVLMKNSSGKYRI